MIGEKSASLCVFQSLIYTRGALAQIARQRLVGPFVIQMPQLLIASSTNAQSSFGLKRMKSHGPDEAFVVYENLRQKKLRAKGKKLEAAARHKLSVSHVGSHQAGVTVPSDRHAYPPHPPPTQTLTLLIHTH